MFIPTSSLFFYVIKPLHVIRTSDSISKAYMWAIYIVMFLKIQLKWYVLVLWAKGDIPLVTIDAISFVSTIIPSLIIFNLIKNK